MQGAQLVSDLRTYRNKHKLDEVLASAVASAHAAGAINPYEYIAAVLSELAPPEEARGSDDGCNSLNLGKFAMGVLKHKPPQFDHFNPEKIEKMPVLMKEVKLPLADQTHEVCFDPVTQCIYVSQMSSSVLVRIPVSSENGLLVDDQDAWTVGETNEDGVGIGGLHNVSLSYAYPGCLWISLQFENTILLVEGKTMSVRSVMRVPTSYEHDDGNITRLEARTAFANAPKLVTSG